MDGEGVECFGHSDEYCISIIISPFRKYSSCHFSALKEMCVMHVDSLYVICLKLTV